MILAIPFPIAVGASGLFAVLGALMLVGSALEAYTTFVLSRREAVLPGHVEPGVAIVEGTARPLDGETLDVPGSDEKVLAYEYEVARNTDAIGDDSHDGPTTVERGSESVAFVLEGGGGEVVVDPEGADLRLTDAAGEGVSAETFIDEATDVDNSSEILLPKFESLDAGETVTVAGRVERVDGRPAVTDPVAPRSRVKVFDQAYDAATGTQLRSTISGSVLALALLGVGVWGLSATLL